MVDRKLEAVGAAIVLSSLTTWIWSRSHALGILRVHLSVALELIAALRRSRGSVACTNTVAKRKVRSSELLEKSLTAGAD